MKKVNPQPNYFELINQIKNNPYLYVTVYREAKKLLTISEFKHLQERLSIAV